MKIKVTHRKKLEYYLKEFYKRYPDEKHTIFHYVKYLKQRLKNNKDAWHGVTGETGSGKSLFVIMVGILMGRPFDLTKNITYIPKGNEILEKFLALRRNTFIVDEAAKELRSVNWQSKSQQYVNTAAMTERYLNNAVYLNMPNFNEFTKSLRSGSIIFRAVLPYRTKNYARVIIQRKSRNWRSDDPWKDKAADKLYEKLEKKRKEITNDEILRIERSLPNTIMDFVIPNLELILPDVTSEYERLKLESREIDRESPEEKSSQSDFYKKKYEKLMVAVSKALYNNELGFGKIRVTKGEIAGLMGVSVETFNRYLNKRLEDYEKKRPGHRKN